MFFAQPQWVPMGPHNAIASRSKVAPTSMQIDGVSMGAAMGPVLANIIFIYLRIYFKHSGL